MSNNSQLPKKVKYCIIGAGIHGLSTAFFLAQSIKQKGGNPAEEVVVIDKTGVAAGASGIACGVVRNNYFQPAMSSLMVESIGIWEQYQKQLNYHSVGYLAVAGPQQSPDLTTIAQRHVKNNYPLNYVEGRSECDKYMRKLFPDWKESDATTVLHETRGGFAYSNDAIVGLGKLAESQGVRIISGISVTGFDLADDESVRTVHTSVGSINVEVVVVAVGPWIQKCWRMLQLPDFIDVRNPAGDLFPNRDMWTYWVLQEGEVEPPKESFLMADGSLPPVIHVDSEDPLVDEDGKRVTDGAWGIYYKHHHGNVQGGAVPYQIGTEAQVDPYGPESTLYTVDDNFIRYWTAGLAQSMKRFENCRATYKHARSGGIGCFSADSFPVFDFMRPNTYVIADSNHGFKMIGVGKEVASVLNGNKSDILDPFRFSRFVEGALHPVSNSPFPWS